MESILLIEQGHSIGIECHDFGNVSSVNDDEVKAGMIFSVEPGIYLKDNIGVRIEDLVLVTKDGCEVLNSVTKKSQYYSIRIMKS